jgi:hypothetical protein
MMNYKEKYKPIREGLLAKRIELKQLAEDNFKKYAKEIFVAHNKLKSFGWNQFTPYYCDGDVCEFHVCTWNIIINGAYYEDNEFIDISKKEAKNAVEEITAFLDSFVGDDLLYVFGDHATVAVSYENEKLTCKVTSYDHD